jgi:hypothetical protein
MPDESGGDFGGAYSVHWKVITSRKTSKDGEHDDKVPFHPDKKCCWGVDDRDLKTFYLVLKRTRNLERKLREAADELKNDRSLGQVVIELPIKQENQIRVLWEKPHH